MLVVPASERRTGTVLLVAAKHGRGERGWTKGKTQISLPFSSLPFPRWNFMRSAFSTLRAHVRPHFRCILSSPPPLWFTLTRYFDDTRSANTDKCTRVWEWRTGGGGKKKITTEQTIRVTWTTATNNVGLVNELSRQKLQLLRVQEVWEPGKWIPCRPMTRDGRENNCWSIVESWVNYDIFFFLERVWKKLDERRMMIQDFRTI